jgi:hypothetical protein
VPTLAVEHYVSAPMVLFVIFKALMGTVMRDVICPYNALSRYMLQIAYGNFLASFACIVGWVVWMLSFDTQWNNSEMFSIYHERLDCNRATDSLEVGRCQAAYLLWGSPLIIGRVGTFHHVSLQSKHQLMTASMVHVTNLTPGSDNPDHRHALLLFRLRVHLSRQGRQRHENAGDTGRVGATFHHVILAVKTRFN